MTFRYLKHAAPLTLLLLSNCKTRNFSTVKSGDNESERSRSKNSGKVLPVPKVVVVAGGGAEGDVNDKESWSYETYKPLIENGDTNNDGVVRVSILTTSAEGDPTFMEQYFTWIAETINLKTEAKTLVFPDKASTKNKELIDFLASSDVVFIKGGDQGEYYDLWNDTEVEDAIQEVVSRGGSMGGTSAGGMSQAGFAFAGGNDLISEDVMVDGKTKLLEDKSASDGSTGIKSDFFATVPDTVIDTHFTQRGRLGRLLGLLAETNEFAKRKERDILAIGIDQRTGIVIQNNKAKVLGTGAVWFIKETKNSKLRRESGKPLSYVNLDADRLTWGWSYDLSEKKVLESTKPKSSKSMVKIERSKDKVLKMFGRDKQDFLFRGDLKHEELIDSKDGKGPDCNLEENVTIAPNKIQIGKSKCERERCLPGVLMVTNAGTSEEVAVGKKKVDLRANRDESLFQGLSERPGNWGVLLFGRADLHVSKKDGKGGASQTQISVRGNSASILVDTSEAKFTSESPRPSLYGIEGDALKARCITGLKLHVLSDKTSRDQAINYFTGEVIEP